MVVMKMTHMEHIPKYCDDCIYYGCKPHPYKGINARVKIPDADQKGTVDELENALKEILEDASCGEAEVKVYFIEAEDE